MANMTIATAMYENITLVEETDEALWRDILDYIQLVLTSVGLVGNLLTLVTLIRQGQGFSRIIRLLLQHQSLVDSWVCLTAILLLVQPPMWLTGNKHFDIFLCMAWHGQGLYWGVVLLSIWNLVFISIERNMAVCHPFKHQKLSYKIVYTIFAIMYILSILLLVPGYLQVRYDDGECLSEYYFEGKIMEDFMTGYGIFWFFIAYAIPCALFFVLYGLVLLSIHRRQGDTKLGSSRVIDKATTQLTKTAITVTIFFIVSLGWDSWFYILGYTGVVEYEFNSPLQKIGVFFSVLNSCANPLIYAASMPIFRESLVNTLLCKPVPSLTSQSNSTLASRKVSQDTQNDNDDVVAALAALSFTDAVTGAITFDEQGDPIKAISIIKIVDGEHVLETKQTSE